MSNFPAQSQVKSKKKRVITPSDCSLYVCHLHTTKVLCICLRGEGGRESRGLLDTPLYTPGSVPDHKLQTEMGIYRDNLSAIIIGDNLLPIIVIAQHNFDLLITDIVFAIYFVIADKLLR